MKALVTGASGFIGSTLIEELLTLGFDVRALMRKTSSQANLKGMRFERAEGDVLHPESIKTALVDVDYVFHLAGATAAKNRQEFFRFNAEATRNVARAVAEVRPGLTRLVYVSSLAASGPSSSLRPKTEADEEKPVSAYGQSKLAGEHEVLKFKDQIPITIIRPPIVYGPRDKNVFLMIQSVARNLMVIPASQSLDGHKHYSTVHSRDLSRAIVQAGLASLEKVPSGEVFFVSGDEIVTYETLLRTIAEQLNRDPWKIRLPRMAIIAAAAGASVAGRLMNRTFALNLDKLNELLPDYWICSNEKAKRMLGFKPEHDLRSGMADAIEWYRKQGWIK